jgi:hypothetical protein
MYSPVEVERFRAKQVTIAGDACYGWTGSIGCNGYPRRTARVRVTFPSGRSMVTGWHGSWRTARFRPA